MKRTKDEKTVIFGDVRIKQSFNSMKDPMSPIFDMRVYEEGQLVLLLNGVAFGDFYASPDKELFVGLSNGGWPGSAAIIFDRRGKVLLLAYHRFSTLDYCAQTSTFLKEWYDERDPQIRFPLGGFRPGKLSGITLRDCHGRRVDLLDTVFKATSDGYKYLRDEINMRSAVRNEK
jgi:hypothetical protein